MNAPTPEQINSHPTLPVGWFMENTDLRTISPYTATQSDVWVIRDEDKNSGAESIIAMALVTEGTVLRLGVTPQYRRKGIATSLISHLQTEYGELTLECRKSLPANDFYEATGWIQENITPSEPEDLIQWRLPENTNPTKAKTTQ